MATSSPKRSSSASGAKKSSGSGSKTSGSSKSSGTKRSTGGKSTSARSSSSAKGRSSASAKSSSKASAKKNSSSKRPVRREVWGIVLLLLALCVIISYFSGTGWLIAWLPKLLKGLFGMGFYLAAPALLAASWILLTHRGKPVKLRVAAALLVPYLFGGIWHMLFSKVEVEGPDGFLPTLWNSGFELASGGVLSGGTAAGFLAVLGKTASVLIFLVLILALLMIAAHVTPAQLLQLWQDRERLEYDEDDYYDDYEDEEEDLEPVRPAKSLRQSQAQQKQPAPQQRRSGKKRPSIDIPLDDEPEPEPEPEPDPVQEIQQEIDAKREGFFRPRDKEQRTPADLLARHQEPVPAEPEPEPVPETPVVPEPAPVEAPEPEPAETPEPPAPAVQKPAAPAEVPAPEPAAKPRKRSAAEEMEEASAQVAKEIASGMAMPEGEYQYPPVDLLEPNLQNNYIEAGAELRTNGQRLTDTLRSFGVDATPGDIIRGPAITRYEFTLESGVKLSKVTNLADDIALALGASGVRIAPIPNKSSVIGIEVPNRTVSMVLIRDVIESRDFLEHKSHTAFAVGKDISNREIVGDISKMPHMLVAGTTGSGKSVCTNSLIISLLYKSSPEDVRFIMVDPKMVELAPYNGIPHLLIPVVTDAKKAAGALQWAVFEMMKRYKTFSELGVKKLEEYNALAKQREDLPHMASVVVVIDELADLMVVAAKEVEESICRVAQMGRAAGMHLVIATQRPSADVITGLMKANIPSRIAFAVDGAVNSRIILDQTGAEKLVGHGDMLYAPLGIGKPLRVQGCYITPEEIERVVAFVKSTGEAQYSDEVMKKIEESVQEKDKKGGGAPAAAPEPAMDEGDELFPAAVEVILETGQASVSMLQRRLKLGYSRAARLVDQMEERGIVGPFEGSKPRQILITKAQWQERQMGAAGAQDAAVEEDIVDDVPWDDEEES